MPSLTPSMYVRICFGAWLQIWANIMELGVRAETGGPQRQTGGLVRGLNVDTARWGQLTLVNLAVTLGHLSGSRQFLVGGAFSS